LDEPLILNIFSAMRRAKIGNGVRSSRCLKRLWHANSLGSDFSTFSAHTTLTRLLVKDFNNYDELFTLGILESTEVSY
jgi:hypothetical protein